MGSSRGYVLVVKGDGGGPDVFHLPFFRHKGPTKETEGGPYCPIRQHPCLEDIHFGGFFNRRTAKQLQFQRNQLSHETQIGVNQGAVG